MKFNIAFRFRNMVFLLGLFVFTKSTAQQGTDDRELWLYYLDKVARPVMVNLAQDQLKVKMPVELAPGSDNPASRGAVSYLEAFGRTFSGIAPWLDGEGGSAGEITLRNQYRQWALKAVANAVNPEARDYLKWDGAQPLVDASFFALGLIRCPWVWEHLEAAVQQQVVAALLKTRPMTPGYNNWILFSGMVEAFFCRYGLPYDALRIDFGLKEFSQHWYTGDGMFSDGNHFHLDFYNSYVIQPYLAVILEVISKKDRRYNGFIGDFDKIAKRYAEIQERLINTDGSFPATGRSIVYRGGAFQHLADMSLRGRLPASLKPAQVRGALTAVMKKTLDAPSTFNAAGWLNIGLSGHQPHIADTYITTGSLYLCSEIFLPLGLPDNDPFWTSPAAPWTSVKVWSGQDVPADHAMDIH